MPAKDVTVLPWQYMMNLHTIFCKIDANSNKLFVLLEPHSSFRFQYRLWTMTSSFEIAVYIHVGWFLAIEDQWVGGVLHAR